MISPSEDNNSHLTNYRRLFVQTLLVNLIKESVYGYAVKEIHEGELVTHVDLIMLQPMQYVVNGEVRKVSRIRLKIEAMDYDE